jgi:hypothetical protein
MSARSDFMQTVTVTIARCCSLSCLIAMAAGVVSAAPDPAGLSSSGVLLSPPAAAIPTSIIKPAGGAVRDVPLGAPRGPRSPIMPVPAPTNHYAGFLEKISAPVFFH